MSVSSNYGMMVERHRNAVEPIKADSSSGKALMAAASFPMHPTTIEMINAGGKYRVTRTPLSAVSEARLAYTDAQSSKLKNVMKGFIITAIKVSLLALTIAALVNPVGVGVAIGALIGQNVMNYMLAGTAIVGALLMSANLYPLINSKQDVSIFKIFLAATGLLSFWSGVYHVANTKEDVQHVAAQVEPLLQFLASQKEKDKALERAERAHKASKHNPTAQGKKTRDALKVAVAQLREINKRTKKLNKKQISVSLV